MVKLTFGLQRRVSAASDKCTQLHGIGTGRTVPSDAEMPAHASGHLGTCRLGASAVLGLPSTTTRGHEYCASSQRKVSACCC